MSAEPESSILTPDEQAYFSSGGETELPVEQEHAPEAEQQAETQAPEGDKPAERDERGKMVPHGALHAEREEHKKTKALNEETARKLAILDDRWNTLLKVSEKPAAQEEKPPNPDDDIFAFAKWNADQLQKVQADLAAQRQQEQQARQLSEEDQAIRHVWNAAVNEFSAKTPDYKDAATHLADLRVKQLSILGIDQATIHATIDNELKGVIQQARQNGANPAEVIYNYAKASGYAGKKPEMSDAERKVQEIDTAQQRGKTISGQPGRSSADPLTAEAIASMPQDEFKSWISKPENERRFKQLMGA